MGIILRNSWSIWINRLSNFYSLSIIGAFLFCNCKAHLKSDRSYTGDGKVYQLHINPLPGSKYQYQIGNESKVNMTVNNKAVQSAKKTDFTMTYAVEKDSADHFLISITYDKIHIRTKTGDQESDLNSENPDDPGDPMQRMLRSLKDATIVATLNRDGAIKTVTGYADVASNILGSTNAISLPDKQRLQQQWRTMIEQSMIKKNMDQLFRIFPDSAVHIGDSWKIESRDSANLSFLVKSIYSLHAIKDGIAEIECQGEISSDSTAALQGMAATAELKGQQQGSYSVDTKSGMLIECKVSANIEGSVQVVGRDIPVSISTEVTITAGR